MEQPQSTPPPVVATAPPVPSGQTYAGFGRRFVAALLDGLVVGILNAVIGIVIRIAGNVAGAVELGDSLAQLLSLLLGIGYYIYFIGSRGQTLGKMALGVKVIRTDGSPVDYLHAFLRETVGKFLSAIVFLLGYLWMLWDPKKQTWHDKIADTVVVKV